MKRRNVLIYKLKQRHQAKNLFYPSRDRKPIGETDWHIDQIFYCLDALRSFFRNQREVYVSGNNFLYFEQGNPKAVVSPDCYVVPSVEMRLRDCYMTWKEEGKLPTFVLEITSKQTRLEDILKKFALYEKTLRVPEYFLFDPLGEYLKPRLQAYRLIKGRYARILPTENRIHSEQLNLGLVIAGDFLRFYDPASQQTLPTYAENMAQYRRAKQEADRAEETAHRAETLRVELKQLNARIAELRQLQATKALQRSMAAHDNN